jgi:large subunit ribosomal protein L18
MRSINVQRQKRALRTRRRIQTRLDTGRNRLSVFRSARYIYAQVIDDNTGTTVAQANSKIGTIDGNKIDQAFDVGKALAKEAKEAGVGNVVFDRGSYRYHGRIKALAEGARKGGLEF